MTGAFVVIALILFDLAMQGAIIFVTAYLLRKSARKRASLSKGRAILFSFCFWAFVMASLVVFDSDMGWLDGLGVVLVTCLTALAGVAVYLWFWQWYHARLTR